MARHRLFRPTDWTRRTIVFYVLFQGVHIGLFAFGWVKQKEDSRLAALNRLQYSVWLSRGAALGASLDACLLVLSMCRECLKFLRPRMQWISLHDSQWFHRQTAYSLLFYVSIHASSHYVNFFNVQKLKIRSVDAVRIHFTQPGGITGHIMLLCLLLMFTTAHSKIRRQSYEGFWYTHHLFVILYLALLTHGTGCFVRDSKPAYSPFAGKIFWDHCIGYQSFRWELFPVTIYAVERAYRFYRSHQDAKVVAVFLHAPKLLEVRFEKEGMDYQAGQWLFVKFPDIIANQWHPFSISSCPEDPYVSVHIQTIGDFTGDFADAFDIREDHDQLAHSKARDSQQLRLKKGQMFPRIRIDGPYGSLVGDVFRHEVVVMVGAGIGITPFISLLKTIWHLRNDTAASTKSRLKLVQLVWVCKDIQHYKWFHEEILALETQSKNLSREHQWPIVRSRIFLTRQHGPLHLDSRASPVEIKEKSAATPNVSEISNTSSTSIEVEEKPSVVSNANEIVAASSKPNDVEVKVLPKSNTATTSELSPTIMSATQFPAEMYTGRPDFVLELAALTRELVADGYVETEGSRMKTLKASVYYCGPDGPGKAVRDACVQVSGNEVDYPFWKERG